MISILERIFFLITYWSILKAFSISHQSLLRMSIFLSFASPKERNKEKEPTKTNSNFFFTQRPTQKWPKKIAVRSFRGRQPHRYLISFVQNKFMKTDEWFLQLNETEMPVLTILR
ncbi:MAG: hypothetical protein Q8L90_00440 [Bacteroidota bacterium]|nr:hypothetical protein [Bacteroidota bacterium]